jgi:predicted amidohydrolase YtcJ
MSKQQADILLTNGHLVTMDSQMSLYPNGAVAIKDNLIRAVGPTPEIEAAYRHDGHRRQNCIISPGRSMLTTFR